MPAALGGYPPVAIRAANLAALDLRVNRRKARSGPRQARDVRDLGTDVIELEDQRIVRATIDARSLRENRPEMGEVAADSCGWVRAT